MVIFWFIQNTTALKLALENRVHNNNNLHYLANVRKSTGTKNYNSIQELQGVNQELFGIDNVHV